MSESQHVASYQWVCLDCGANFNGGTTHPDGDMMCPECDDWNVIEAA